MENGKTMHQPFPNIQYRTATKNNLQLFYKPGEIFISLTEILNDDVKYFKQMLFCQVSPTSLEDAFSDILLPKNHVKQSVTQTKTCESLITQDELWLAFDSFQTGKTLMAF